MGWSLETRNEATLILSYDCVHEEIADLVEQSIAVGVVEENVGYVLHPKPATITPEVIITAGAITIIAMAILVVKRRPRKG